MGTILALQSATASEDSAVDIVAFRELARSAARSGCADEQALYVVDEKYVVYWYQGRCPDAGGGVTLFGAHPEDILCSAG